jgi:prolipoprotein diacylglyceryl transferase
MSVAYLPSPVRGVWYLGPVPVRAYAVCMVAGVVAALWLTDRRYRRAGGEHGVILAIATVAVPVGLVGARIYSVTTDWGHYFGPGRDWVGIFRFWQGGLGIAGAVAAAALGAWYYCRRAKIELGPVALAAAPALPVAQAIAVWGNWFNQNLYGAPSSLPWAVAIDPVHRAIGYESYATFQPIWLYQSLLDILVAVGVSVAIKRLMLTGDRAFAVYAGLYAIARFCTEALRIDYSPRLFGLRTNQVAMLAVLVAAVIYLYVTRSQRTRRIPVQPAGPAGDPVAIADGSEPVRGGPAPSGSGVSAAGSVSP